MARDFLSRSLPAELILHILGNLDTARDIASLGATCRRLHDIWQSRGAGVLWRLFLRETPEFDDVLIAARLTELVRQAEVRDELPPMGLSPGDFSGRRRAPTIPEIKAATALYRLLHALAVGAGGLLLELPRDRPKHVCGRPHPGPESPDRMPEWERRVRNALCKLFVCSAALAGAYNEPLFRARASGSPDIGQPPARSRVREEGGRMSPSASAIDFLMEFPVCNLQEDPQAEEAVFGPVCDWLLDSILSDSESRQAFADRFEKGYGRALLCLNREEPGSCPIKLTRGGVEGSHSDAHLVFWEVMKLIWVYRHPAQQAYPRSQYERLHMYRETDQTSHDKAVAVFFGVFRAQQATLLDRNSAPQRVTALLDFAAPRATDHVQRRYDDSLEDARFWETWMSGVTFFSEWIQIEARKRADRAGHDLGDLVGLLNLKFFDYFLRRNSDLLLPRVSSPHFVPYYESFSESFAVLAHDDVEGRQASRSSTVCFSDGSEFF